MTTPRLADLIPREDFSTIHTVHFTADVVEAIEVTFAITRGLGGKLANLAAGTSAKTLVDGMLELAEVAEGALTVLAPLAAVIAEFAVLGIGYAEALENISEDWATRGFALGVVLAVDGKPPKLILDDADLWSPYVPDNPAIDAAKGIALRSYQLGMIAGLKEGRRLDQDQRRNFWLDLIAADGGRYVNWDDQRDPSNDFYRATSVVFRREHLQEAGEGAHH